MMNSLLQTHIQLRSFEEKSSKKEAYFEEVYQTGIQAKKVGVERLLLHVSGSSFSQVMLSEQQEKDLLCEYMPTLLSIGLELMIDTWKAGVIRYALQAGIAGFYDVSSLKDPDLIELATSKACDVIIPFDTPELLIKPRLLYPDMQVISKTLAQRVHSLHKMGIKRVMVDPFGLSALFQPNPYKTWMDICRQMDAFKEEGLEVVAPIMKGASKPKKVAMMTMALEKETHWLSFKDLVAIKEVLEDYN